MGISFTVGRKKWEYKPQGEEVAICQAVSHYRKVEASVKQIFELITQGRCWRAGTLKDNAINLKKDSFTGAQILALDFDEFSQPPEETVEYCKQLDLEPSFWYYSFSQGQKAFNNYRIVWVLDRVLTQQEYEDLYRRILEDDIFTKADKATKDINRLWFGTNKGGQFIKEDLIPFDKFNIFVGRQTAKESKKEIDKPLINYNQGLYQEQFIMDERQGQFDWWNDLYEVCDLWTKWVDGVYLHHQQRLLLFTELKMIRYNSGNEKNDKTKLVNKIMSYYDLYPSLYVGSKCNRQQIIFFLSDKTGIVDNKIVRYDGEEYTIAEYFHSGAYKKRREERIQVVETITREEQKKQADEIIPQALASGGITYIECQTESGKTERILDFLAKQDYTDKKIIYAMPTHILLREVITRAERKGINNILCPRKVDYSDEDLLYLDAGFPEGVYVSQDMIARKKELEAVKDPTRKGLFFLTHAAITHMTDITADLIIIDENIEDTLIDKNRIYLPALHETRAFVSNTDGARDELDKLIQQIEECEVGHKIEGVDIDLIFKFLDYRKLVRSKSYRQEEKPHEGIRAIGKLRKADLMKVGKDYKGNRYLYFEVNSRLLRNCLDKSIPIKLFTGTPKRKQLKEGLKDDELYNAITQTVIERAGLLGEIIPFYRATASKGNLSKTFIYAKQKLEEMGVNWREIPLLTLKSGVKLAKEHGFLIPQTEDGENIYIENAAGLDILKGKDLIVIGKPDIELNSYIDMVDDPYVSKKLGNAIRRIEGTGIEIEIYGYLANRLFDLQAEQIREGLEQAVARARLLWYNSKVYLFSDFPVRGANNRAGDKK